jgi:hypothetical protein
MPQRAIIIQQHAAARHHYLAACRSAPSLSSSMPQRTIII